jgi:hypothetical protein
MDYTPTQIDARIKQDPEMQHLALNDPDEFDRQHAQMYDSFGFNPDGSKHSTATKVTQSIENVTGIPRESLKSAAQMGLSLATTVGGAAVGSKAGPAGAVAGAMAGSLAGERLGSTLGINDEPTTLTDALAVSAPLIGPLAGKALQGAGRLARNIPGVGTSLHQIAAENLDSALQKVRVTSEDVGRFHNLLTNQIKTQPFSIAVPKLRAAVQAELADRSNSLVPNQPYIDSLTALEKQLSSRQVSFSQLMSTEHSFNELKATAPTQIWKKLSGTLIDDLDTQAVNPKLSQKTRDAAAAGAQAFKNFVKVNRKANADDALESLTKASTTEVNGDAHLVRFNKDAFAKKLKYDEKLNGAFDESELAQIKSAVDDVGYLGWGPTSMSNQSMGQYIGRSGGAGAVGFAMGGSKGAMTAFAALAALNHALGSSYGRSIVKYLAKNGQGKVDALQLKSMLGKAIAGTSAGVAGINQAPSETQTQMPVQE